VLSPYWARCRNTGYAQVLRETISLLYQVSDLSQDTVELVSHRLCGLIRPGFYRHVLNKVANISYCQVHSREAPVFCETKDPALLSQDLVFTGLALARNLEDLSAPAGIAVKRLSDWLAVIDWYFEKYAARAIALKNHAAYARNLDFEQVDLKRADLAFSPIC